MAQDPTTANLQHATAAFDSIFSDDLRQARDLFAVHHDPFHLLGLGVCAFLEAALGMEAELMTEATRCLALSEAGAKKQLKLAKSAPSTTRFPSGTEWELIHSDAVILLGLTHALSESYMGYLQCLYAMNSAHSKFSKLYKTVYPHGLADEATPATSVRPSPEPSIHSLSAASTASSTSTARAGFFGRWSNAKTVPPSPVVNSETLEDLILSGTAFGYGLFNLVFSLLPAKIRGVVGFLGFQHDRKLALQALAVAAAKSDVHSVFAGLTLMTYHGVVLLLAGYQADEAHILRQYRAIVDKVATRYPTGSLWILNRAKILRMSCDAPGAISVLKEGLAPGRPHSFPQADGLLIFELAWTLLSQRRYEEAAETFIRVTEINSWSHGTYYFIAAGCHISLRNYTKAQELFDMIPALIDKKKIGGKDLPTEVFIKKKIAFYKEKQKRRTGSEDKFVECISISPAEELAIFWNTHTRIGQDVAEAHVTELLALSPSVSISTPYAAAAVVASPTTPDLDTDVNAPKATTPDVGILDLDTSDELAIRALLLGIVHRTAGAYPAARAFLTDAYSRQSSIKVSTWVGGVALFELAVLELKEADAEANPGTSQVDWTRVLKGANERLDGALALATQQVDLSSRLDSRIAMLRDEIVSKRDMVGLA